MVVKSVSVSPSPCRVLLGSGAEVQGPLFFIGHTLAKLSLSGKQIAFCREP